MLLRDREFFDVEDLVVPQRPIDGLMVDLDVRQERERWLSLELRAQRVDFLPQRFDSRVELRLVRVRDRDAGRRDAADVVLLIVAFAVGAGGRGEDEEESERADRHEFLRLGMIGSIVCLSNAVSICGVAMNRGKILEAWRRKRA